MTDQSDRPDAAASPLACEPGIECDDVATEEADVITPPRQIVRRGRTFESFRNRDFVWFWLGALVSNVGTWMQNYALGIVVFAFRRSEFDLGLINFISGIPVLFLAIPGGLIADRVDRRRLLIWIQAVLLIQAAALGWLYNSGRLSSAHATSALLWVASLGVLAGVFAAVQFPSWQAMLPDLVPKESLLNGIALNSAQFQSSRLIGPLVAGALVVAGAGMGEIFYVNAASFLFVMASLAVIHPRVEPHDGRDAPGQETIRDRLLGGLRYARDNRAIGVLIISTAVMTIFGFPYMTLLPAIVNKTLGFVVGSAGYNRGVAIIMATNGLGAMVGALGVASLPPTVRRDRVIPLTLLAFGLSLFVFSLSRALWLTSVISTIAGAALMTTNSMVNTSIQSSAPPHLRGRVMGLFVTSFMGLMPVSGLLFGSLGQYTGPATAVLAGSVVLIAWCAALLTHPSWLAPSPAEKPASA